MITYDEVLMQVKGLFEHQYGDHHGLNGRLGKLKKVKFWHEKAVWVYKNQALPSGEQLVWGAIIRGNQKEFQGRLLFKDNYAVKQIFKGVGNQAGNELRSAAGMAVNVAGEAGATAGLGQAAKVIQKAQMGQIGPDLTRSVAKGALAGAMDQGKEQQYAAIASLPETNYAYFTLLVCPPNSGQNVLYIKFLQAGGQNGDTWKKTTVQPELAKRFAKTGTVGMFGRQYQPRSVI